MITIKRGENPDPAFTACLNEKFRPAHRCIYDPETLEEGFNRHFQNY